MEQKINIDISPWTVIKIVLVLVGFYLVFLIKDIILLLLFVIILSATFSPVVSKWEKKIGRIPAVLAILAIIVAVLSLMAYLILPPFVSQVESLAENFPSIISKFKFLSSYQSVIGTNLQSLSGDLTNITGGFINLTTSVFGGLFTFLISLVLTIYLLIDREALGKFITSVVPTESQSAVMSVAKKMATKMGDWFRGQLFLGLCVAIIDYIGLLIIGVPYAIILALLSGILDFVPTIGPIIAGTIAVIVALMGSPIQALAVAILYIIVQQLEGSVLAPKIMQKAVGLSPVVIILAVLIGAKLFGLIGALLAVPTSALISVVIQEWHTVKNTFSNSNE